MKSYKLALRSFTHRLSLTPQDLILLNPDSCLYLVTCEECPLLLRFHSAIHISGRVLKLLSVRFGTALTGASDNEQRPTRLAGVHSSQSWARRAISQGSADPVKESVVNTSLGGIYIQQILLRSKAAAAAVYSIAKSCPTLWDPMDYSLPGSRSKE